MKVFFAGARKIWAGQLIGLGVKSFLSSYENPNSVIEAADAITVTYPGNDLMIDSGAFTAWTKGRQVNLKEYIEFCKDTIGTYKSKISNIYMANLDVIPGEQGRAVTKKEVEDAAKQGWDNMLQVERAGLTPIHIFHQGEDFEWLKKLSDRHQYIGISPCNDVSTKAKAEWLKGVYSIIGIKNKTHGYAATAKQLMEKFPWYSVDSMSWASPQMWGKTIFCRGFEEQKLNSRKKSHVNYILTEHIKGLLALQKRCTELWRRRGVVWSD